LPFNHPNKAHAISSKKMKNIEKIQKLIFPKTMNERNGRLIS
jgi:spore germination cell wall hydrolase CwlJ-like protein